MNPDRPTAPDAGRTFRGAAAGALFAFVFSARAWLVKAWGSPVPFWDEWDADALGLFRPWLDGTLRWSDLFAPHNEHRIVLTRMADLTLFLAGGNWNPWWPLMLNAALHAATASVLVLFFWPAGKAAGRSVWLLGLALLFAVPSGWQNALWGFQSQVYFCSLLSVLALGGLLLGQPLRQSWWGGWFAALLALFALGSGLLAAATVLLVSTLALVTNLLWRRPPRAETEAAERPAFGRTAFQLLAVLAVLVLGWSLRAVVPQHEPLRAHSLAQFGAVFFRCLSWPWVDSGWLWLGLQAPLLWLASRLCLRRIPPDPREQFILGLGLLAVLHAAAVAYTRGAGLPEARPLSRYQDALLFGVAANLLVLLNFAGPSRAGRIAALGWTGVLLAGLLALTTANFSLHLPFKRAQGAAGLAQVRAYLATRDATVFTQEPKAMALHPDTTVVRQVLDDPQLQRVLPREFFDTSARPPWPIEFSPWLTLASAGGLLLLAIKSPRRAKA